jgi:hypothetical protein
MKFSRWLSAIKLSIVANIVNAYKNFDVSDNDPATLVYNEMVNVRMVPTNFKLLTVRVFVISLKNIFKNYFS